MFKNNKNDTWKNSTEVAVVSLGIVSKFRF